MRKQEVDRWAWEEEVKNRARACQTPPVYLRKYTPHVFAEIHSVSLYKLRSALSPLGDVVS